MTFTVPIFVPACIKTARIRDKEQGNNRMTDTLPTTDLKEINDFHDKYYWLSNFYKSIVCLDGVGYHTVEHAFQAAKTDDPELRQQIRSAATPGKAKKLGRSIPKHKFRSDWEEVKVLVMYYLLRQKFSGVELCRLQALKDYHLVEGNTWGDKFWGVCDGEGHNVLGKLLMLIRDSKPEDYIDTHLDMIIKLTRHKS